MKKKQIAITLGIMCFILTVAISVQLKTVKNSNATATQSLIDNGLRDEVLRWKEKYDNAYQELLDSEKQLTQIREQATQNNTTANAKQEQIKENDMLLGRVEVKGAGLEITLADNNAAATGLIDPSTVLVHYDDLLQVVNALNNAGAEAISINGQRIITTTAITCEGNVIKINGEKISSPFTIKAIGSQGLLLGSMTMAGGYLNILEEEINKRGLALQEVIKKEHFDVALKKVAIGNAIKSIHSLQRMNFSEVFEKINGVEEILKEDPSKVYSNMDYKTKEYYRNIIKEIADKTKISEIYIARKVVELAKQRR